LVIIALDRADSFWVVAGEYRYGEEDPF